MELQNIRFFIVCCVLLFDFTWHLKLHLDCMPVLLAHLSRRLIGELLVYKGIRRLSVVRPSVVRRLSTFSNDISSEAVRPILFIFHI